MGKQLWFLTIFGKNSVLNLSESSEDVSGFKHVKVLRIRKFLLKRQGSGYSPVCSYGRVLNIPGFRVYQVFAYASIAQSSEYS